jgi:hypothetical protein
MASKDTAVQVFTRLPKDIIDRLDAHVERMQRAEPGIEFSRADAAKTLIVRGLDAVEATESRARR